MQAPRRYNYDRRGREGNGSVGIGGYMFYRAIALSLALLIGIGTIIPLATEAVEAGKHRKKRYHKKKYRKYSRAWWRQYRAKQKRKRALMARKRALRLRQLRLARLRAKQKPAADRAAVSKPALPKQPAAALLPTGAPAPEGWAPAQNSGSEIQFSVDGGRGTASISVVGPAMGETVDTGRNRTVGGVPISALRREVINRMIRENGWVVNDYQKEIGNKKVYVVVAQSQGPGSKINSRMFYFTEVEGRIFSVATNTAVDSADRIAEESEKVINSLQASPRPAQQAAIREE